MYLGNIDGYLFRANLRNFPLLHTKISKIGDYIAIGNY